MATNFPGAVDNNTTLPNPAAANATNSPSHASQHANANDAVKAIETKVGTGASVPAAGTLMIGTGAGTSSWSQLTSAQLAAVMSDETGSGSVVFGNTPTLITPKVDTINENTPGNGVTVGGVNLKSGLVPTSALVNKVDSAALQDGAVTGSKIGPSAITLASINSSASQGSISGTAVLLTGLAATVTVPAGGRKVRIEVQVPVMISTAICTWSLYIYNSLTPTGSPLNRNYLVQYLANVNNSISLSYEYTPTAGSQNYCAAISTDTGTGSTALAASSVSSLSVKVV